MKYPLAVRGWSSRLALFLLGLLLFAPGSLAFAQASPSGALIGWLNILWGDPKGASSGQSPVLFMLSDDQGISTQLFLSDRLLDEAGGILQLNHRRVAVQGLRGRTGGIQVTGLQEAATEQPSAPAVVSGSQPFVSILCKFNDVSAEGQGQSYFQGMYGSSFPGLDHFWREASYGTANVLGSNAVGWLTLPHLRSYYVYDMNGDGKPELDFDRAANDCTAAADPTINFTSFVGINLMFNSDLDGYAWGGSHYMTLDGVTRSWPMTWEPPWGWGNLTVIAHEMGHAFGLPHSSGSYGQTYDNAWDVMSDAWNPCSRFSDATYGCLMQQTIAYHRDRLGWVPAAQKYIAVAGSQTIALEQLTLPETGNYLLARIPLGDPATHFYTVEARDLTGYDRGLPGSAVIIHEVDTTRINPAHVVDIDGNGNTADAGAMWLPGETFSDTLNGVSVTVNSATLTGFVVTITTPAPACYALVMSSNPANGGAISAYPAPNCSGSEYSAGTVVNLTATANPGYAFSSWGGSASGTANPTKITMNGDKSVTANFSSLPMCYTLTTDISPAGSGTVIANPAPNCNGTRYTYGTVVKLTAHPVVGYAFSSWSGDAGGSANPTSVTLDADRNVTANLVPLNLLKNAGFEADANADKKPDNWTSSYKFTRSSMLIRSGRYAGRFFAKDNTGVTIKQTVAGLAAGRTYTLSGWINIPPTADKFTYKLQVKWRNGAGTVIRTDNVATFTGATADWEMRSAALLAPAGTRSANVVMAVSSLNATIYVDDLYFGP